MFVFLQQSTMNSFRYLCHFETENGNNLFTDCASADPTIGSVVDAYPTYEDLVQGQNATTATISKVLCHANPSEVRYTANCIFYSYFRLCLKQKSPFIVLGLMIRATRRKQMYATEHGLSTNITSNCQKLSVPANPPVWTKPPATLASPNETISMSRFCASHLPDWEVSLSQPPNAAVIDRTRANSYSSPRAIAETSLRRKHLNLSSATQLVMTCLAASSSCQSSLVDSSSTRRLLTSLPQSGPSLRAPGLFSNRGCSLALSPESMEK